MAAAFWSIRRKPLGVNNILNLFYRRITTEDLSDAPKGNWREKLLYAINLYFQQSYSLFNNGLTPEQNCIAQTKTFSIIGNAIPANNVYSFTTTYTYFPLGYDLLSIQPTDGSSAVFAAAPYISWTFTNGVFNVIGISGLADGIPYQITLRLWWGAVVNA